MSNSTTKISPASPATEISTFQMDLNTTVNQLSSINQGISTVNYQLNTAISYISYPSEISKDLTDLVDGITALSDVLLIVELIPDVGPFVGKFRKLLPPLKKEINAANRPVMKVAELVNPYKKSMESLESKITKVSNFTNDTQKGIANFSSEFNNIVQCVENLPTKDQSSPLGVLGAFASDVTPTVVEANKLLHTLINYGGKIAEGLENGEQILKSNVVTIGKAIHKFIGELSPLFAIAKDLQSVLEHKISVPYGLKITGPWYEPWNDSVKIEYFTFTVKEILTGIEDILEDVERFLLEAAKDFLGPITDKLNTLFKKVENYLEDSIPGLSSLAKYLMEFEEEIGRLTHPSSELTKALSTFIAQFNQLETMVTSKFQNSILEKIQGPCIKAVLNA